MKSILEIFLNKGLKTRVCRIKDLVCKLNLDSNSAGYSLDQWSLLLVKGIGVRGVLATFSGDTLGDFRLVKLSWIAPSLCFLGICLTVNTWVVTILLKLKGGLSLGPLLLPFIDVSFVRDERQNKEAKEARG